MRSSLQLLVGALSLAAAWPTAMHVPDLDAEDTLEKRVVYPKVPPPRFHSGRDNCGSHGKCTVFNAKDQFVDVRPGSGHVYKTPGPKDLRGQCPGLNAASNHAFLPRNGIATTQQTIDGLGAAYSMSPDLALILAVIAIAISGDPVAGTWSIGSGFNGVSGTLLGRPTGIVGTHNRYEGDASIVKGDAYMNKGSVVKFEMHRWEHLYSLLGKDGLTHDKAAAQAYYTMEYSVQNNPYAFWNPFSGLVAPDAHNFVVNFMSNRSEENKGGVLHGNVLKSFFGVTGTPGNFKYHPGQERIPLNWYKRPTSQPMNTVDTNVDTVVNDQMYPGIIKFGGNTGKVNTFTGFSFEDLTDGVINGGNLAQGNNAACFFLQAAEAGFADPAAPILKPLFDQFATLGCPQLKKIDPAIFSKFPGANYKPSGL